MEKPLIFTVFWLRNSEKFKYVLMMGDCSYDFKDRIKSLQIVKNAINFEKKINFKKKCLTSIEWKYSDLCELTFLLGLK